MEGEASGLLVRHEETAQRERSTCGWRHLLLSRQDRDRGLAAWAHAVDIDGAREHYHKVGTELYYVLDGEGSVMLDGVEHPVRSSWTNASAGGGDSRYQRRGPVFSR